MNYMPRLKGAAIAAALMLTVIFLTDSCSSNRNGGAVIELTWINPPAGETPDNQYILKIKNTGGQTLTDVNWALYFHALHGVRQEKNDREMVLTHIDGDYYKLTFAPGNELKPGETEDYIFNSPAVLFKYTALPLGFYSSFTDRKGRKLLTPAELRAEGTIRPEDSVRGANDILPVPDALSRFEENRKLELLRTDKRLSVLPTPARTTTLEGDYPIPDKLSIVCPDVLKNEAEIFLLDMKPLLSGNLNANSGSAAGRGTVTLELQSSFPEGTEGYRLELKSDGSTYIKAGTSAGIFYGLQTFRSLLAPLASDADPQIPLQIIDDIPRFPYRGLHVDVARNFHSVSEILVMLDAMAMYKMNKLHLHLTDDEGWRLEISGLPELTEVGGRRGHTEDERDGLIPQFGSGPEMTQGQYYTRQDFRRILRYANDRHISVIPEIDMPGHARAAIKSMEERFRRYTELGDTASAEEFRLIHPRDSSQYSSVQHFDDNVVDVGLPSTYRFIEKVVSDIMNIYSEEGLTPELIHFGGDEVPRGVWVNSPACRELIDNDTAVNNTDDLFKHFFVKSAGILKEKGTRLGGWEEVGHNIDYAEVGELPYTYVWNTVWGWENEDLAYTLADKGYPVILSNVTNLYFDLAYDKDPEEAGLYWGGFVDTRKVFEFTPMDFSYCAWTDRMGHEIHESVTGAFRKISERGRSNILGLQGQLWSERLQDEDRLQYMAFPKLLALAERAWAPQPAWSEIDDREARLAGLDSAWAEFTFSVGQKELPRLDRLTDRGIQYRIPLPGLRISQGKVYANILYPGLTVRFTTDGTAPTADSPAWTEEIPYTLGMRFAAFTSRGRSGRTAQINLNDK